MTLFKKLRYSLTSSIFARVFKPLSISRNGDKSSSTYSFVCFVVSKCGECYPDFSISFADYRFAIDCCSLIGRSGSFLTDDFIIVFRTFSGTMFSFENLSFYFMERLCVTVVYFFRGIPVVVVPGFTM